MMVDKINQNNENFLNPKENIYKGLIDEFETHLLPENKKLAMIDYLKNNCEINFSKDVIMILEDYNSIISQAIQAIRSLLSENEKIGNKKINYDYSNYYNKNNPSLNIKNDNNFYNYNYNNNSKSNFNSIYNNKNNANYNNYNNINFQYGINNVNNNNDMNNNNNFNNTNNINYENNKFNKENNNYNYNYNEPTLNYDYLKNKDITSNEPLKKPIREQLKTLSKENSMNNLLNTNNPNTQNLNNYNNNGKNSLRMAITGQIPKDTNTQNYSFNNNNSHYNINNNNNNLSIYNSNTQTYENTTNMKDSKKREIEKLKVTNKILKLIEIANQKKNYFVEKYVNSSSLNYENDYKEFLNRIINYKFDILTLNQILIDLKDFYLNNPRNKSNKKKENYSYSKEKFKYQSIENQTITESNEAFKKNLRKYSYPSLKKPPFVNATNPYGHLFS